jgi:hypothetical protein
MEEVRRSTLSAPAARARVSTRLWRGWLVCLLWTGLLVYPPAGAQHALAAPVAAPGTTYYVDCANGNDGNGGMSETQAWRTLGRASNATLVGGDALLLKRGCTWGGPLNLPWQGSAAATILISAYGTGNLPTIQSNTSGVDDVAITGSYLVIDQIYARAVAPQRDPGCGNAAIGKISGFTFKRGAANNTLQNSLATDLTAGATIDAGAHDNRIVRNTFQNNTMMEVLAPNAPDSVGAFGVNVHGDNNEIAFNSFTGQVACSYQYETDGAAVEIYQGKNNQIHHNSAVNNQAFTELGNSQSADNVFSYNVVLSDLKNASFLTTRGSLDTVNGPVPRTKVYNNSVFLTGSNATALVCYSGCSADILTMKNTIIWSEYQIAWGDNGFDDVDNIYWRSGGNPVFKLASMGATSRMVDPQFVSTGSGSAARADLHLRSTSPAIDGGVSDAVSFAYTADLDGVPAPQGARVDIGAYEFAQAAGQTPTPTPTTAPPTATRTPTSTATPTTPAATRTHTATVVSATLTPTATAALATATRTPTPIRSATATATTAPPTATRTPTAAAPTATRTRTATATAATATSTPTQQSGGLRPPGTVFAIAGAGSVRVQWSAITTAGVTYNVYRGTTSGGEQLYAPGLRGTRLDDSAVTRGQTYYYRVTAVNAAGESAPSREVSARVR